LQAHIDVDGTDILVSGDSDLHSRSARRFFHAVLGGRLAEDGWRVPCRSKRAQDLVVRINAHLQQTGFTVTRGEVADRGVELELERRRSIERSRDEALAWRAGTSAIDEPSVLDALSAVGWNERRALRPHQLRNVMHGLAAVNQANFSVPGAGKTVTALAIACVQRQAANISAVLVVGPLACFEPWETESAAAVDGLFRVARVRGTATQRRAMYATASRDDLLLVSYATAAADRISIKAMCERLDVMLIVDESHRIKRFAGGVWAPALAEIAELARVRMILSGTPMPNSPRDLFSQLNVLWPGGLLTGSRTDFANRVSRGVDRVLPGILPFTIRTAKAELGLPPYEVLRHDVPMVDTQAEIYEMILHRLQSAVADADTWEDKLDALRRGRPIRLLQVASNPGLLNHPDDHFRIASATGENLTLMQRLARFDLDDRPCKSVRALELVAPILEHGDKVVVWSNFLRNLDSFRGLATTELGATVFQVDGRVPTADDPSEDRSASELPDDDTRERRIEEFLNTNGAAILVANPATCSESISLHRACQTAVYLDRTYDAALFLQSIDRIHRLGLRPDADVKIHLLHATHNGEGSIDHLVDASLLSKQAAMEELLGGAELHPLEQDARDAEGDETELQRLLRYLIGAELDEDDE
jgi:SNF2 family DNA or RNA helicase